MDMDDKHILTGNFNIIKSNKLRETFLRALSTGKIKRYVRKYKATANIITALEDCIDTLCVKNGQHKSNLLK